MTNLSTMNRELGQKVFMSQVRLTFGREVDAPPDQSVFYRYFKYTLTYKKRQMTHICRASSLDELKPESLFPILSNLARAENNLKRHKKENTGYLSQNNFKAITSKIQKTKNLFGQDYEMFVELFCPEN